MKNYIVFFLLLSVVSMVKAQNVVWDEYYATTVFTENFNGNTLNPNEWSVEKFKRDIGLLIDSPATLDVDDGKLGLTMISCPGCQTTNSNGTTYYGDYAGAEITSKRSFQYGVFECRAKYATLWDSWPAF
jgi:beta-glucanase (GH16 family)